MRHEIRKRNDLKNSRILVSASLGFIGRTVEISTVKLGYSRCVRLKKVRAFLRPRKGRREMKVGIYRSSSRGKRQTRMSSIRVHRGNEVPQLPGLLT